jgi:hypothetical protein
MASNLTPPPKYGTSNPAPQTLGDWVSFFRWLFSLWNKAANDIGAQQSITIAPRPNRVSDQETLRAAQVLGRKPEPQRLDAAAVSLVLGNERQIPAASRETDAGAIGAYLRPPYPKPSSLLLVDSHANRANYPATGYPDGTEFWESDRRVLYVCVSNAWIYASGIMAGTVAQVPGDLGANDAGFLYRVTTGTGAVAYNHLVRWNGSAWEAADQFGGFFQDFALAPTEPGWHLCDGSATKVLQISAGSLVETAFTTPNLTTGVYRKGGTYTGTVNGPGTISLSGTTGSTSAGTPSGTVSQPIFIGNALGNHLHLLPFGTDGTSTNWVADAGYLVANVDATNIKFAPATIASSTMQYSLETLGASAGTPSGVVSQPSFSGTSMPTHNHDLSGASATFSGAPVSNIAVPVYFRR